MVKSNWISVEVAYATPSAQKLKAFSVRAGISIHEAILISEICQDFPEIDLGTQKVGVFGEKRMLDEQVQANDRIEIYRPLIIDPKEARRLKASIQQKKLRFNPREDTLSK